MTLLPGLGQARLRVGPDASGSTHALEGPDLLAAVTAVAERVLTARVRRVAVFATPELKSLVAVLGALRAGVPAVLVSPHSGSVELAHVLADSEPDAWLGSAPEGTGLASVPVSVHARSWHSLPEPAPGAPALVLYTSGTTGPPKGVVLSRQAVAGCLDALAEAWGWTGADTVAHGLPVFHLHGLVLGVLGPLRLGGGSTHTVRPTPQAYAQAVSSSDRGATMLFAVPTVWSRIVREPEHARALGRARLLVSGSAPLPVPVGAALADLAGQSPVERYGMSETLITLSTRADGERRLGSVGLPLNGVATRLRSESGEAVAADGETVGRLEVRAPWLFSEYLGKPEATLASFTGDGWFSTGDLATIGPDGFHRIVGRESVDLIKSGGYRIGAGEVEAALLGHPAVAEAAVVGVPDEDLGQRIVAWVVAADVGEKELADFVAASLSTHKRPREIRFVSELPRNQMGKVLKKELR
ncbi:MAG: acyl-CoA synthetase [Segniliparus sp.]|uniref:acyl-CoA synthetase n=1 Tax=Segniliparus sp. TaxID=2804064 RepID=UPI003F40F73D